MRKPKKWLYKWVGRFKSGDADWFADDSRAPKHSPSKTSPEMTAEIVAARECLERTPYACRGAFSIRQKLASLDVSDAPLDATMNRVISAAGLVKKSLPRVNVGTPYPAPTADGPNDVHQLDLWGRGIWEWASPAMSSTSSMWQGACPAYIPCPTSPLST
jgi:hypothetical protein